MIKILWLCGIVLPEFSDELGINKNPTGGWMTGLLHQLDDVDEIEISLCFPIYNRIYLKDGRSNGYKYYTFLCNSVEEFDSTMVKRLEHILSASAPDIVHIWGTESSFTTAMLVACQNNGLLNRTIVNIQGLVSICSNHYLAGIPEDYTKYKTGNSRSLEEDKCAFVNRGECEKESIRMVHHVIGRTDWDKACVEAINPSAQYYFCGEVLRDIFYQNKGSWKYDKCKKYSIFLSQASYPIKGLHYLLQALPYVIKKYPDTHVYIAGKDILNDKQKGSYALYLSQLMMQLDLNGYIFFLGKMDEQQMVEQYQKANVFVLSSTVENSPNSLAEAMLIGVPSVASYVGGTYGAIDFGISGFLYPYDEPPLLAYYICKIFENKNEICKQISCNSSSKMSGLVDPKANTIKSIEIYKDVLESGKVIRG